jgi:hypothetical protein
MTKSIASYPPEQRRAVIARRLAQNARGSGYWAARSAADKLGIKTPSTGPRSTRPPRKQKSDDGDQAPAKKRQRWARESGNKPFTKLKQLARR